MINRSIHWLSGKTEKPILRLTEQDYNQNNLSDLLVDKSHYDINLSVFNKIQRTIQFFEVFQNNLRKKGKCDER